MNAPIFISNSRYQTHITWNSWWQNSHWCSLIDLNWQLQTFLGAKVAQQLQTIKESRIDRRIRLSKDVNFKDIHKFGKICSPYRALNTKVSFKFIQFIIITYWASFLTEIKLSPLVLYQLFYTQSKQMPFFYHTKLIFSWSYMYLALI